MALQFILMGPPASGKGTQGRQLAEREGLAYLSTGAVLRQVLSEGGEIADKVRPILSAGGYISDDLMCAIVKPWLEAQSGGWVLDGFPRTVTQDQFLLDWLAQRGETVDAAVALRVPKEELIRRIEERVECPSCQWTGQSSDLEDDGGCLECGAKTARREDDSLENFLNRHDEYVRRTVPVIERHRDFGSLIEVDAILPIEAVAESIRKAVNQRKEDGQAA
ncbi:MAG: adenylate kinase family protein [Verrucomicrobiales bacterium]